MVMIVPRTTTAAGARISGVSVRSRGLSMTSPTVFKGDDPFVLE